MSQVATEATRLFINKELNGVFVLRDNDLPLQRCPIFEVIKLSLNRRFKAAFSITRLGRHFGRKIKRN